MAQELKVYGFSGNYYLKSVWYRKWYVKWLALAEKFKEAK